MPESLDESLDKFLAGDTNVALIDPTASATNVPDIRNVPRTAAGEMVSAGQAAESRFVQSATRDNVPLDVQTGAPTWQRMTAARFSQKAEELDYWRSLYGPDNVDVIDGKFVLRNVPDPESGEKKDILVDEAKVTAKDMALLLADAPELALSLAATLRFGGANLLKQAAVGAATYAGAGGLSETVTRAALDQPLELGEEAQERGKQAAIDTALGFAIPFVGRGALNLTRIPVGEGGSSLALEGFAGRRNIAAKEGIELPASLAERMGSSDIARAESFASQIPFARGRMLRHAEARIASERRLQRQMMGDENFPDFSQRAREAVLKDISPQMSAVEGAKGAALRAAGEEALSPLQAEIGQRSLSELDLGTRLQTAARAKFEKFRGETGALYDELNALPEIKKKNLPADNLSKDARELIDRLPSKEKIAESVDYDAYGSPVIKQSKSSEELSEFIPSGVLGKVRSLAGLKGQQMRLDELIQMRREVDNSIAEGEAIKGYKTKYLAEIRGMLTKSIEQGLEGLGGKAKELWKTANDAYAKGIVPFKEKGIEELLIPAGQTGSPNLESYVRSITAGGKGSAEQFARLKTFFADSPQAFNDVKQHMLDTVFEKSVDPVTRTADFKDILTGMRRMAPEVKKELFGDGVDKIEDAARFGLLAEGKVSVDALKEIMTTPGGVTRGKVNKLIEEQAKLDDMLQNQVKKAVADGYVDPTKINPDEFVDRYILSDKVPVKDVREALDVIGADDMRLLSDIRRKAFSDIFRKVQKTSLETGVGGEDAFRRAAGDATREIDNQKMALLLDNPKERERLKTIFGSQSYELLRNYVQASAARGKTTAMAGMAGAQAGGGMLKDLVTNLKGMTDLAKFRLMGWLATDQRVLNALSRPRSKIEMNKWLRTLTMSPEFARAMVDDIPDEMERAHLAEQIKLGLSTPAEGVTP